MQICAYLTSAIDPLLALVLDTVETRRRRIVVVEIKTNTDGRDNRKIKHAVQKLLQKTWHDSINKANAEDFETNAQPTAWPCSSLATSHC